MILCPKQQDLTSSDSYGKEVSIFVVSQFLFQVYSIPKDVLSHIAPSILNYCEKRYYDLIKSFYILQFYCAIRYVSMHSLVSANMLIFHSVSFGAEELVK